MKKVFSFILCLAFPLVAQTAGESGLSFLKNGFGARNIAMGDLAVASANDVSALFYNPALIGMNDKSQISFSHNSLFQDLKSEMFGAGTKIFGLPIAFGLNTTNISNIEIRTRPGEMEGTFNANYFWMSASTAYQVFDGFYAGVTYKYLHEDIYTDEANGYGFDFGVAYKDSSTGLSFGVAIKNIGDMNALRTVSTELPKDFSAGANYTHEFNHFIITGTAGVQKYFAEDVTHLHLGCEAVYNNTFFVRAGYLTGNEVKNISAGFGIIWKSFTIDYAYVPVKYGIGDSNIISMKCSFN